jgi:hypothetical protein
MLMAMMLLTEIIKKFKLTRDVSVWMFSVSTQMPGEIKQQAKLHGAFPHAVLVGF